MLRGVALVVEVDLARKEESQQGVSAATLHPLPRYVSYPEKKFRNDMSSASCWPVMVCFSMPMRSCIA